MLLLQQEIPEKINLAAAEVAKAQGVTVIQDVGGEDRPISAQLLSLIDFLCPNENELQRLTGMPVATREEALLAAKSLVSKGVSAVLVTLGERGAMVVTKAETLEVAPFAVPSVVDGTAAGDAFRAALAVAIGEKQSLQNGLRLASAAGALAVSRKGAEPSLPHRKDCEALLGGSSVEQVLAAQALQSLQGSCEKSWAFASRLNSMKERLDLWNGSTDTLGLIERQGQVKGLGLVYLNFPQHLEGLQPQEMLKALDKAGLKAGGIALRFPEHMRLGALTNPSRELRQEAVELTKSACRWAESLGTEEVVVWPQTDGYDYQLQVDYLSAWSRAVEAFREVLDSSACRQKKVSLEFKPTDEISRFALVPSTGAALLFLRDVDRENFGLTLDVGHLLMAGENPAQSVAMAGAAGKLFGIHLNDGHPRLGAEDGLAFASVHRVAALELVLWLGRVNYTGSIYFDTFPKNEDPVREAELNVRRFEELWEQTGKMDEEIKTMQEQHDAMGVLEFLDSLA